jgi:hypothetical protein
VESVLKDPSAGRRGLEKRLEGGACPVSKKNCADSATPTVNGVASKSRNNYLGGFAVEFRLLAGRRQGISLWTTAPRIGITGIRKRIMAKQSLVRDFIAFVRHEKKWWLVPLLAILLLVGVLIVFAQSSPLAPFIYPFF